MSKELTLKVGDKVKLPSGGPVMTIESISDPINAISAVTCVWFEGSEVKRGRFKYSTLELSDSASGQ